MEGHGVTSYSVDKPSYAFSASTTEFDDALIQRGIVTLEQAMMGKGASAEEAKRLADLKRHGGETEHTLITGDSDSEEEDSDDDEFLRQYRQQRIQELKHESTMRSFGEVISISRPEWNRHVNEDSEKTWVVVTLASSDTERTGCIEEAIETLSAKFRHTKFVSIPSKAAIANWPDENLPTIFLYRHGKMQEQLIQLPEDMTAAELEWKLAEHQVLETTLEEAPASKSPKRQSKFKGYQGSSTFGGTTAQLATRQYGGEDD